MSTTRVIRVPIAPLGMINAFLVVSNSKVILVDAGLPNSEAKIGGALQGLGLGFSDVGLIVVTHGHIDHAGGAARMRQLTGAPIALHAREAKFCAQDEPMQFCPTGPFGRLFLKTGLIKRSYEAFDADIVLKDGEDMALAGFGAAGVLRASPGHTEGSVSVELSQGDALVGDLVSSGILLGGIMLTGRPKRPPFEDDAGQVATSLQGLLDRGSTRFHMGHGGPLPGAAVSRHVHSLRCQCS